MAIFLRTIVKPLALSKAKVPAGTRIAASGLIANSGKPQLTNGEIAVALTEKLATKGQEVTMSCSPRWAKTNIRLDQLQGARSRRLMYNLIQQYYLLDGRVLWVTSRIV